MTDVVAALIWDGDKFLACQRPAHKTRGLLWEFAGGKVECGETKQEALIRECREELGITLSVGEIFMELIHEYPDMTVRLTLFNATVAEGIPQKLEHNDIRWITTKEIDQYSFCPADDGILSILKHVENGVQANLISMRDEQYKAFLCPLIPTVRPDKVIGIRMPRLRKYARQLSRENCRFLAALPHRYYEEDNLHGIIISEMVDFKQTVEALEAFLPHVDNWSTCDLITPKAFRQAPEDLIFHVKRWMSSNHSYAVRFAISVLMKFYLDEYFQPEYLQLAAAIRSEEYYVNMMVAWYFATALAKQYDAAIPYLERRLLPAWTHKKTIQKAVESYRITPELKAYLKNLK